MNIQVERLPECKTLVSIELPSDSVAAERAIVIGSISANANVPGFRRGKVPPKVIEQRYGKEINGELEDRLINSSVREAIEKEKLSIIGVDDITGQAYGDDGGFSFVASVTTTPEFELPDYKAIPIRLPKMEIGEEQVEQSIDRLRERYATFNDIEDRGLQMGDFAVVSYEGFVEGKPLAEAIENVPPTLAKAAAQWIKMDEDGFLPGFCNGLIDAKTGESKEVSVAMDEDFPIEAVQGKELVYQVEIAAVKVQELPEVNDEFAAKVEEGKTLEELKTEILSQLETEWEQQLHSQKVNQIVEYLDEKTDFELPASVVANEVQGRVDDMAADAQKRGMPEEQILAHQEEIIESARAQAKVNVKTAFLLERIAEEEKFKAEDQEVTNAILNMAARQGVAPKKYIKELQKNNGIGRIRHNILTQKALSLLVDSVEITEFDPADEPAPEEA